MKTKKNKKIASIEMLVKAARKASREEEIRLHGKPINYQKVTESKKVYNRKNKANRHGDLPYLHL